jgi:hypothetical protein
VTPEANDGVNNLAGRLGPHHTFDPADPVAIGTVHRRTFANVAQDQRLGFAGLTGSGRRFGCHLVAPIVFFQAG